MATRTEQRYQASQLEAVWHVIDAEGKTLGRLSSEIAVLLQGKHKPTYVSYLNSGDFVIVVNAEKIRVTGKKLQQKIYYRHSGYHGGLKQRTLSQVIEKTPTRALKQSVKGMLPKSKLGRRMLSRLKLYTGGSHPHSAQVNVRRKSEGEATLEPAPRDTQTPPSAKAEDEAAAGPPPDAEALDSHELPKATPSKVRRPRATSKSRAKAAPELKEEKGTASKPKSERSRKSKGSKATAGPGSEPAAGVEGAEAVPTRD